MLLAGQLAVRKIAEQPDRNECARRSCYRYYLDTEKRIAAEKVIRVATKLELLTPLVFNVISAATCLPYCGSTWERR